MPGLTVEPSLALNFPVWARLFWTAPSPASPASWGLELRLCSPHCVDSICLTHSSQWTEAAEIYFSFQHLGWNPEPYRWYIITNHWAILQPSRTVLSGGLRACAPGTLHLVVKWRLLGLLVSTWQTAAKAQCSACSNKHSHYFNYATSESNFLLKDGLPCLPGALPAQTSTLARIRGEGSRIKEQQKVNRKRIWTLKSFQITMRNF